MVTKHSKDHLRHLASGKVVAVKGHDYEATEEEIDQEFEALFGAQSGPPIEEDEEESQPVGAHPDDAFDAEFAEIFGHPADPEDPTVDQEESSAPPPAAGTPGSLFGWVGKNTPDLLYGTTLVKHGQAGLKPMVKVYLPKTGPHVEGLIALGAKWKPILKCWGVVLPGTPNGGGKQKAVALETFLQKTCGPGKVGAGAPLQAAHHVFGVKPTPAPAAQPTATPHYVPAKGNSMAGWTQVGHQKGSNPGGLFKDPLGKQWYVKFPATADHAKNELLACKLYKGAGAAIPEVKLVTQDGKVGIASAWVDGTKNVGEKAGALHGAKDFFGVDAWLGNWDVAGMGFDNLLDHGGKALRIDAGGSLLYRAQGSPKGAAFGTTVPEVDSLLDPATNPNTAKIFSGMSKAQMDQSVARALAVRDEHILAACEKWGPGDAAARKALADKLIARKAYLAKRFPGADRIANPPAPDPRKLPVSPEKLPVKVDFSNYGGTGKGKSTKAWKNAANQKAFDELYACAMKGDLVAFKAYKYEAMDPETGTSLGMRSISEHGHPNGDIASFYQEAVAFMEAIAYPSNTKVADWLSEDVSDVQSLSEAFPGHPFGVTVGQVPKEKRLGFWISLGNVQDAHQFLPKKLLAVTDAMRAQVKADYAKMPADVKKWLGKVQGSGSNNMGDKAGQASAENAKMLKAAYDHATEFPEGTVIHRWLKLVPEMIPMLDNAPAGHVFENPRSQCCSMTPGWENSPKFDGGDKHGALLKIIYAKGAKGLPTAGSGGYSGEQEITSLPGQRYMLLKAEKHPSGKPEYTLLALPPDPTYVSHLKGAA